MPKLTTDRLTRPGHTVRSAWQVARDRAYSDAEGWSRQHPHGTAFRYQGEIVLTASAATVACGSPTLLVFLQGHEHAVPVSELTPV